MKFGGAASEEGGGFEVEAGMFFGLGEGWSPSVRSVAGFALRIAGVEDRWRRIRRSEQVRRGSIASHRLRWG